MQWEIITVGTCAALQTLENGEISYSASPATNGRYIVNTMASFKCDRGYDSSGSNSSTCQTSLDWNPTTPVCMRGNEMDRSC